MSSLPQQKGLLPLQDLAGVEHHRSGYYRLHKPDNERQGLGDPLRTPAKCREGRVRPTLSPRQKKNMSGKLSRRGPWQVRRGKPATLQLERKRTKNKNKEAKMPARLAAGKSRSCGQRSRDDRLQASACKAYGHDKNTPGVYSAPPTTTKKACISAASLRSPSFPRFATRCSSAAPHHFLLFLNWYL